MILFHPFKTEELEEEPRRRCGLFSQSSLRASIMVYQSRISKGSQSIRSDEALEEQPKAAWSGCAPYTNPVSIVKRQPWSTMTPPTCTSWGSERPPAGPSALETTPPTLPQRPQKCSSHRLALCWVFHLTTCRNPHRHGL